MTPLFTFETALFYFYKHRLFKVSRSKKIFLAFAVLFFVGLGYISYDISSRTTFPGSKPQLQERIKDQFLKSDTVPGDSAKSTQR
ncbi:MAG: hypothetical protein RIA63_13240 [Cyclobacteriaceae bacterium]